ncbi:MAG: AtpZ/AtpI family protein [Actinobacteria bacterium]|nr:AtpZ/AtpI family protein [Actinomycetota bacterium]
MTIPRDRDDAAGAAPSGKQHAAPHATGKRAHESDHRHYDRLGPIGGGEDVYSNVLSRLLAGPLVFGLLGWLLDRWFGTAFLLPVGLIGGMALAIYVIWLRYGTAVAPAQRADRPNPPHEETQ